MLPLHYRSINNNVKFDDLSTLLLESPQQLKQYKIEHVVLTPWGTPRREYFNDITCYGVSPEDALSKFIYKVKMANAFPVPTGVLINQAKQFGAKVIEIGDLKQELQMSLPYKD